VDSDLRRGLNIGRRCACGMSGTRQTSWHGALRTAGLRRRRVRRTVPRAVRHPPFGASVREQQAGSRRIGGARVEMKRG
jgi:hypothetical protein